jgi:biopolymer transport protein ExbB/TolQ
VTVFHVGQGVLAVVAVGLIAARLRALFFEAPLPVRELLRVLEGQVRAGDVASARRLAQAALPAWVGRAAEAVLGAHDAGADPLRAVDPLLLDLRYEAGRGLWAIRTMATMASALGLLGALVALMGLLHGDHGLAGLVEGLPERLAFERALLSMLMGLSTAGVCLYAWRILRRRARRLLRDAGQVADAMLDAVGVKGPAPRS